MVKNDKIILHSNLNLRDGLWDVPFQQAGIQLINYIITKYKSKNELAQYLYGCTFSPVISTFQECINKGSFISWPGMDHLNFKKFIKMIELTIKGHQEQERKNLQSTKAPSLPSSQDQDEM